LTFVVVITTGPACPSWNNNNNNNKKEQQQQQQSHSLTD